jgi:diamine N-acetyltransferase
MATDKLKEVSLKEITEDTLYSILDLEVKEEQKKYVASNATSIAEAHFSDHAWLRGIFAGEEAVGLVLLYIDESEAEFDLWRMMVDKNQQGKGYGAQAVQQIIDYVAQFADAEELTLSYLPGKGDPASFFERFGFKDSDEWIDEEKILSLDLTSMD